MWIWPTHVINVHLFIQPSPSVINSIKYPTTSETLNLGKEDCCSQTWYGRSALHGANWVQCSAHEDGEWLFFCHKLSWLEGGANNAKGVSLIPALIPISAIHLGAGFWVPSNSDSVILWYVSASSQLSLLYGRLANAFDSFWKTGAQKCLYHGQYSLLLACRQLNPVLTQTNSQLGNAENLSM